jgi:hypothetical protein
MYQSQSQSQSQSASEQQQAYAYHAYLDEQVAMAEEEREGRAPEKDRHFGEPALFQRRIEQLEQQIIRKFKPRLKFSNCVIQHRQHRQR